MRAGRIGSNECLSIVKAAPSTVPSLAAVAVATGATNPGVEVGKVKNEKDKRAIIKKQVIGAEPSLRAYGIFAQGDQSDAVFHIQTAR
jgi:hypothetical protein